MAAAKIAAKNMSPAQLSLAPPPGLKQPSRRSQPQDMEPAYVAVSGIQHKSFEPAYVSIPSIPSQPPVSKPSASPQYQVLLCGLPEAMTHPAVIGTMMEQANLTDGIVLANKMVDEFGDSSGKVLVTFANSAWAKKCIKYFNGRWANAGLVVSALIVGILPGSKAPAPVKSTLSAEAPVFKPSTEPPVPMPLSLESLLMVKEDCQENKVYSDASTKGSAASNEPSSDNSDSDSDSEAEDEQEMPPMAMPMALGHWQ
eukprot:gnl/TRDRNA2_/TRDRNA2_62570_c0_seq2.p1 gnl/TRDRNA2_/TRDRNA2_62570_c0~~gnl/TRDRNA2_/TRDRNA2_62570_c0_seq2.p1  ORF type:complete len:283 (-),score=49.16 gnl/TRDRNA2_/TRDRNA2_62570_c0_seq2:297-1064(-)